MIIKQFDLSFIPFCAAPISLLIRDIIICCFTFNLMLAAPTPHTLSTLLLPQSSHSHSLIHRPARSADVDENHLPHPQLAWLYVFYVSDFARLFGIHVGLTNECTSMQIQQQQQQQSCKIH